MYNTYIKVKLSTYTGHTYIWYRGCTAGWFPWISFFPACHLIIGTGKNGKSLLVFVTLLIIFKFAIIIFPAISVKIKFIYSEKATKFCKISIVDLNVTTWDKSTLENLQNFVAFSEYMNFKILWEGHKNLAHFPRIILACQRSERSKANCQAVNSSKKQMNKQSFFIWLRFSYNFFLNMSFEK